jgi:DNA polymerase V
VQSEPAELRPVSAAKLDQLGLESVADLVAIDLAPRALLGGFDQERGGRLMATMDAASTRFGRGTVILGATGIKKPWETKFEKRSPRYTTQVSDLPSVE